jgi:enamine deaminase RidA (YjgF/YER057c/UK114 family)
MKKVANFGVAWENDFGYVKAIQVKDTIYLSGQLSHDSDGNFFAPAELDKSGRPVDYSQMEQQFRQTYVNAKKMLSEFAPATDHAGERDNRGKR